MSHGMYSLKFYSTYLLQSGFYSIQIFSQIRGFTAAILAEWLVSLVAV